MKKRVIAFLIFILLLPFKKICFAAEDMEGFQSTCWENLVDVYVKKNLNLNNINVKVSNQAVEIIDGGFLSEKEVIVRTTILVDISKSIPSKMRESVKSFVETLIGDLNDTDQVRLATFGDKLTILQDFTSDRYDLIKASEKIEFTDESTMIYDAIYNTMPVIQLLDENNPCYYRTIIITDGIDKTANGITKEELFLKLKENTYPVEAIAVTTKKQDKQEKELAALTRISGGTYENLYNKADVSELVENISTDDIFWIRTKIPTALLDGSIRQIDVIDENGSYTFDLKLNVYDVAEESFIENQDSEQKIEPNLKEETNQRTDENIESKEKEDLEIKIDTESEIELPSGAKENMVKKEDNALDKQQWLFFCIPVIILMILIICILLLIRTKKKKIPTSGGSPNPPVDLPDPDNTIMEEDNIKIRIHNAGNSKQVWEFSTNKGVLIGRDHVCNILIQSDKVSRQQCLIYSETEDAVLIKNLSNTNITKLNGERLDHPKEIFEGDRIKCGDVTLVVDFIYKPSRESDESLEQVDNDETGTILMFPTDNQNH